MRIENTRISHGVALQHRCGFYDSSKHLMRQLAPMLATTLARGTTVALAVAPATEAAIEDAFGPSELLVRLSEPGTSGQSGQTLAARRARELRRLTVAHGPVTMVNEHRAELDGADGSFWTELDAAFGIALADLPVELTCFYPALALHREITDGAHRTHPVLIVGGALRHNPDHLCPRAVLAARPAPAPTLLGAPHLQRGFGAWQLNEVRADVEAALVGSGYGQVRAEDVVLAVNEVATNAVEYGSADAKLFLWLAPDGAVCEVHDRGRLRDPLPGLTAPHTSDPRGRGVWIARQICESLHVWSDPSGTHVRMHAGRPV